MRTPPVQGSAAVMALPFIAVGSYLLVGRFAFDAWVRRGVRYAVTDRRVLIVRTFPTRRFTTLALNRLPQAALIEGREGRGSIRFGPEISVWNNRSLGSMTPSLDDVPQFLKIDNVRTVFDLIQKAAAAAA